jgi:hypothetical protein
VTRRPHLLVAVLTVLAAGTAACSSGGEASPGASASSSGADLQRQVLAIGRRFAQCARDHGYPTFPDMVIVDGKLGHLNPSPELREQEEKVEAIPECRAILGEVPPNADLSPLSAAEIRKLRDYAQCLRGHGVPEWPDPKADGSFPLRGTPLGAELRRKPSPRIDAARAACRQHWNSGIRVSS